MIGAAFIIGYVGYLLDSPSTENNYPKQKIHCIICDKDLTDDYNRISPNGGAYYCTPCYKATMRQVRENIRSEGYD